MSVRAEDGVVIPALAMVSRACNQGNNSTLKINAISTCHKVQGYRRPGRSALGSYSQLERNPHKLNSIAKLLKSADVYLLELECQQMKLVKIRESLCESETAIIIKAFNNCRKKL